MGIYDMLFGSSKAKTEDEKKKKKKKKVEADDLFDEDSMLGKVKKRVKKRTQYLDDI